MSEASTKVNPGEQPSAIDIILDKIGLKHWPIYKLAFGGYGEATQVSETNPLPVSLGAGDLTNDAWGVPKVSIAESLFSSKFTFDIDPAKWFMYEDGVQVYTSTDITSSSGALKMLTTATNSVLLLESRECPRYQPNRGHL
jgi:hypothetical protein